MNHILKTLCFFLYLHIVAASICSSNSVIPFSGYKVTRRHKIRIRPLQSDSFLVLTKCHRGIPVFSRTVHTSTSQDEFAGSFQDLNTEFDFSDRWRKKHHFPMPVFHGNKSGTGHWTENIGVSFQLQKLRLKEWFHSFKSKKNLTSSIAVSNNDGEKQPKKFKTKKSRQFPVPPACLKMARRKRYARSNMVIFIPATFVGVLFSCTTKEQRLFEGNNTHGYGSRAFKKQERVQTWDKEPKPNGRKKSLQKQGSSLIEFTENNTFTGSPICPLVADDYSSHWVSIQISPPALIYHVPYLRSPSVWDPRFRTSLMGEEMQKWDNVDINEEYNYTDSDLSHIGEALAASTRYIQRLFDTKLTKFTKLMALKVQWFQKFDPRVQFSLMLFSLDKPITLRHIVRLQRLWDSRFKGNTTAPH